MPGKQRVTSPHVPEAAPGTWSNCIRAGEFRPTPSPFACSGCPALDVVCAGPRLGGGPPQPSPYAPQMYVTPHGLEGWHSH